jgi:hypothetical protein
MGAESLAIASVFKRRETCGRMSGLVGDHATASDEPLPPDGIDPRASWSSAPVRL